MAQGPEDEEGNVNPSHDLDLATLFRSASIDAENEAATIEALLASNDIPAVVVGVSSIPSLEFQVRVPHNRLADAERLLAEAREAGPEAAAEAEAASENLA
jgi:hypothetical protein